MKKLRPIEIFLIEVVIYLLIWMANDYLGSLLSLIFGSIFFCILIISLLAEWIERSKVPRWYYSFMLVSVLAPVAVSIVMILVKGQPEWLQQ